MSFLLTCPNCGVREVTDFGYGGEISARPTSRPTLRELGEYNYFRRNRAGVQREWWFHRSGCRAWFIAERDTRTNEVLLTALPDGPERRWPPHEPAAEPARRADRPRQGDPLHVRRQGGRGVRGRHGRLGALRRRPAHVLAQLQVPPPARAVVLRRPVPELHRRRRRRARRSRLHRAGPRGHEGRASERRARVSSST